MPHLVFVHGISNSDEVQDKLAPGYSADDGYPLEKLTAPRCNVYDPRETI